MFSKKPRRNFRTRRDDSSEEDEDKTIEGEENSVKPANVTVLRRSKLPQSRGISCSSKPEAATVETKSHTTAEDAEDKCKGFPDVELLQQDENKEHLKNDGLSSSDEEGVVPDPEQIRAALKQRREAKAQKDYIPLVRERPHVPPHQEESDGNSHDDDDDDDRIQFAPKPKTLRELVAEEMGEGDYEEDGADSQGDEDQTWEKQQIRKGLTLYKHSTTNSSQDTLRNKKKCEIPESLPQVSIDVIKKRVSTKLDTLRQVSRHREMDQQRIQMEMSSARAALEQLESGRSQEQHRFYKGMRLYTHNLLQCLGEKVVEINAVELDMHTILIDQAEALLSRRRESVKEVSTHLQLLAYATDPSNSGHADKAQAELLEQSQSGETAESGDENLPEEAAELSRKRDEIMKKAENIFVDVHEEFSDVKNILSKFDEWRVLFPESYDNAYISLCLPKLLAPLVRHQLIGWNPLRADCEDIKAFPWYSAVEMFCHRQGCTEESADHSVLRSVIEKTIVPKIQGFVELIWDPLSRGQSRCLVGLCRSLLEDHQIFTGEQSKPAKAFLEAVEVRMRSAVDVDVFIPLYPKQFLDDVGSPHFQFRDKQFYSAVKLLHNIMLWHSLVPDEVLIELGLTKLLSRYLMITLRNALCEKGSVEKCKKVAACFPKSWFEENTSPSIPELEVFSKYLLETAHALCEKNPNNTITRDIVTDLLILLRNMKALDSVKEIVEHYHLEGF